MATDNIREKLNMLNGTLVNEDVELLRQQLIVQMASETTNDRQIDANFQALAQNARAQITAAKRRIVVYEQKRDELQAEIEKTDQITNGPDKATSI